MLSIIFIKKIPGRETHTRKSQPNTLACFGIDGSNRTVHQPKLVIIGDGYERMYAYSRK